MSDFLATPGTVAYQAPLSLGFSRQKYWSRLPFPSPADFPDPGIKPVSPALAGGFFTTIGSSSIYSIAMPSVCYRDTDTSLSHQDMNSLRKGAEIQSTQSWHRAMWGENISCVLINKKCHSHQRFLASRCEWGLPKLQFRGCRHPPKWLLRSWGNARSKGGQGNRVGPGELRCMWKEWVQWAQRLASSHTYSAKLSLMFRLPAPFVANIYIYIAWFLLLPPQSNFLRATEMLSPRLGVLNIPTK